MTDCIHPAFALMLQIGAPAKFPNDLLVYDREILEKTDPSVAFLWARSDRGAWICTAKAIGTDGSEAWENAGVSLKIPVDEWQAELYLWDGERMIHYSTLESAIEAFKPYCAPNTKWQKGVEGEIRIHNQEHFDRCIQFAIRTGQAEHFFEALIQLRSFVHSQDRVLEVYFDSAPASLYFDLRSRHEPNGETSSRVFNGGLIYHGNQAGWGNESYIDPFAVRLTRDENPWSIHT